MSQLKTIYCQQGETRLVENEWAAKCEELGTTISGSAWAFTDEGAVSGATLTGTLASALLSPQCSGWLTNTLQLASGETLIGTRWVEVERYC